MTVSRAQVWRDIYYIAVQDDYSDYREKDLDEVVEGFRNTPIWADLMSDQNDSAINIVTWVYGNPDLWDTTKLFAKRGHLDFKLEHDQFFPMGDNSAASSDARVWGNHSYVDRRFLIGKALLVFFPHLWMSPVPHPNFPRMGRIR